MNITANTVVSKLTVALVAAAMLFSFATPSKAATVEELQAQIAALMAQISALGGASTPASSAAACTFTRALTVGSQGEDVKCLQTYLSPTYFKNAGGATGYFGPVTQSAVAAWQSANGVTPAAGYFGSVSQAKYNALMASAPTTPGSDDSGNDDGDNNSGDLSGEASLDKAEISSADDDTIEEGAEDASIAEFKVKFTDGDAKITRLDLTLTSTDVTEKDPWDTFENISVWVDGDKVGDKDASSKDDYLSDDDGTIRISGLDIVANEDDEVTLTIAATVQGSVDGSDNGNAWKVSVDNLRFVDGEDVTTTDNNTGDLDGTRGATEDFSVESAGGDDELTVKTSDADPDGTTLQVKDDAKSDWYTIFAFDLDTKDSTNDITLNDIYLTVDTTLASYATLVDDVELDIDGTTIDDVDVTTIATTSGKFGTYKLHFNVDGDATIDAGDRATVELKARFKSLAPANEGATIDAFVTSTQAGLIDAEGADDLGSTQLSGAAAGEVHTIRTKGISVEAGDITSDVTTPDGNTNDYGTYTVKVDVTAFEQDVYVNKTVANSILWSLTDGAGASVATGTRTTVLSSSKESNDDNASYFKISEGETETLTLKVTYVPGVINTAARLNLTGIKFAETPVPFTQTWTASPASDYQTDVETIVN